MYGRLRKPPMRPGNFDPGDTDRVKHTSVGVWDLYEERQKADMPPIPGSSRLETYAQIVQCMPYVVRMLKDILSIRRCRVLLSAYLVVEVLTSLEPAISLWYSGQLLRLVNTAIETRTVDKAVLIRVAAGRTACTIVARILRYVQSRIMSPLNLSIKRFYIQLLFRSMARLDVPTFEDSAIQRQLESTWSASWGSSVAWSTVSMTTGVAMTVIRLVSQLSVLSAVLREQQDGPLLASLTFVQSLSNWYRSGPRGLSSSVWAATTTNVDYIRMQGLKKLVNDPSHRKELVAGNLGEYITAQFRESAHHVGDNAADFREVLRANAFKDSLSIWSLLREPMNQLPQIVFCLRAVQKPMTIPLSLASMTLINQTSQSFTSTLFSLFGESFSLAEQFQDVRKLYEFENVPNKVVDGTEPFPEDQQSIRSGISLEFRNVSFQYPGAGRYALHDVSFKITAGQLCVIVGGNGSGKSTILKLVSRIYDPTEGTILIDNRDIKTLRLAHLRAAMSTLFQDYTHFPLSISDNIALGNPALAHDADKVREAARLGGAEAFVDKLSEGFNTYLDRPVRDYYSDLPEGTTTLFGRPVDFSRVRRAGGLRSSQISSLSGGQMQRLAVSRTFMRSLGSDTETSVGMLLFDEPSAALDPNGEHDLFERLRELRGSKTMIFSSHRFGNLTRHADLILYMDDSAVQENGTHDDLLKQGGKYAHIWNLQAKPFQ
ncbi:P-loop containing nucleoside triphosphate hydrolase protein [Rhizopogon salebrosus TDB-379]|nr:P-loop containing nucleoside triphosphate hydrolase protein [Rhizopogon salebrosus TDB-379]